MPALVARSISVFLARQQLPMDAAEPATMDWQLQHERRRIVRNKKTSAETSDLR